MDDLLIQPMVKTEAQAVAELAGAGYPCTAAEISDGNGKPNRFAAAFTKTKLG